MKEKFVLISDVSLRDGNHAVAHKLSIEQIKFYCQLADDAKVPIVEVGHGNGIGASSLLLGEAAVTDKDMLITARNILQHSKLSIHVIPGFATIEKDLKLAIECGVDIIRVASHCSEANITERHIKFAKEANKIVYGVLMMSHMLPPEDLAKQAKQMENYGAEAVIFMDSSGHFLPSDVKDRVIAMKQQLSIDIGFHAHNNLGMAIANSIAAIEAGTTILDGSIKGFGAGAGNAQLEVLIAVLHKLGYFTGIDFYKLLDASNIAQEMLMETTPTINTTSIVSGLAGVFSGFLKPVQRIAKEYNIDPRDLFFEIGKRKMIAGQEDLILQTALDLLKRKSK